MLFQRLIVSLVSGLSSNRDLNLSETWLLKGQYKTNMDFSLKNFDSCKATVVESEKENIELDNGHNTSP